MKSSKKLFFAIAMVAASVFSAQSSYADRIHIEFGASFGCWLPGICSITIETDELTANADATFDGSGVILDIPKEGLTAEENDQLMNGHWQVTEEYHFTSDVANTLGIPEGSFIPAGDYPVMFNEATEAYTVHVPVQ